KVGSYQLTLTVSSPSGTTHINKTIVVMASTAIYKSPYEQYDGQVPETNRPNRQVIYPVPSTQLSDKVIHTTAELTMKIATATSTAGSLPGGLNIVVWVIVIAVLALIGGFALMRRIPKRDDSTA